MLVHRVAYSGLARYSPQQMASPKGENREAPEEEKKLIKLRKSGGIIPLEKG